MKKSLYYYLFLAAIIAGIFLAARAQSDKPKQITWDGGGISSAQDLIFADTPKTNILSIGRSDISWLGLTIFNSANYSTKLTLGKELRISDTTGTVAMRDSCGNWIIKDAGRALEAIYILLLKDKHF